MGAPAAWGCSIFNGGGSFWASCGCAEVELRTIGRLLLGELPLRGEQGRSLFLGELPLRGAIRLSKGGGCFWGGSRCGE